MLSGEGKKWRFATPNIILVCLANRHFFPFLSKIRRCHSERSEESTVTDNNLINTLLPRSSQTEENPSSKKCV
jgi:hypothetical protein